MPTRKLNSVDLFSDSLKEYQQAIASGQFKPLAGDSTVLTQQFEPSKSRAEVLSTIKGVDLTEGDAS